MQKYLLNSIASRLTVRRVRTHSLLVAVCLWTLFAVDLSTSGLRDRAGLLKGTDFIHFYTLGSLALQHKGVDLYNMRAQSALMPQLVPQSRGLTYLPLYGPQVSLFFAPLAKLPYGLALAVWWALTTLLYGVCCYSIWKTCPQLHPHGLTIFIAAAAYPAFFHLIAWGQTSAPALLCFTLAFLAFRNGRQFLAGLAIGLLAFKPALGLAAAIVFLCAWNWRVVAGAVISSAAQIGVGWTYYGTLVMQDYVNALRNVPNLFLSLEPRPYQVDCLRAFWALLIPFPVVAFVLYAVTAVMFLALTVWIWKSRLDLPLRYSALLLGTVLVAPHLTVYDLVILAPAFLLLTDWTLANRQNEWSPAIGVLLYLGYMLPLAGPLASWTHIQLAVIAFAALVCALGQIVRSSNDVAAACLGD